MKQIVKEPIRGIPHLVMMHTDAVHGVGDPREMFEEAEGDVFIHRVVLGQDQRDLQHAQAVERHPSGTVGLIQVPSGG